MDMLGLLIYLMIIGVAVFPKSFGKTIALIVKGYKKEIGRDDSE